MNNYCLTQSINKLCLWSSISYSRMCLTTVNPLHWSLQASLEPLSHMVGPLSFLGLQRPNPVGQWPCLLHPSPGHVSAIEGTATLADHTPKWAMAA